MALELKNEVLNSMINLLLQHKAELISVNEHDMIGADNSDVALYDRLRIDEKKFKGMIQSLSDTIGKKDPVGIERYHYQHGQGLKIVNRSAPFGTILIIYESRPDVTIEAAALAFKAGSKILLKGGKEARNSNLFLVSLWQQALMENNLKTDLIQYLDYSREQTNDLLRSSKKKIDLIVPRGGDGLIEMVKSLASAPVLVSGRGNNFIYVHEDADLDKSVEIIYNSKLNKISVCNATDKVLFNKNLPDYQSFIKRVSQKLIDSECEVMADSTFSKISMIGIPINDDENILYEEFLSKKIMFSLVDSLDEAIGVINKYSGGHTAVILTEDNFSAAKFMEEVDAASVIHNASSRYTDGGQFGLGAELAISTDKLHHRGPLGLDHLVTNKWYVYGDGQIRE
ncbi:MAG: glutamate-5-semialdehyde dehydrogenase [Saprospiraceae bacterium]